MHLITSEALELYAKHVKPIGVIAFHVTNRFLDLVPVVAALADAHGMQAVWIHDDGADVLANRSDWVLLSKNTALLANPQIAGRGDADRAPARLAAVDRRLQQPVPGAARLTAATLRECWG